MTDKTPPEFRYRRAPRYRPFITTGVIAGAVAGIVVGVIGPENARYSTGTQIAYLAALFALLGGVLGGVAAVLAERRTR